MLTIFCFFLNYLLFLLLWYIILLRICLLVRVSLNLVLISLNNNIAIELKHHFKVDFRVTNNANRIIYELIRRDKRFNCFDVQARRTVPPMREFKCNKDMTDILSPTKNWLELDHLKNYHLFDALKAIYLLLIEADKSLRIFFVEFVVQ